MNTGQNWSWGKGGEGTPIMIGPDTGWRRRAAMAQALGGFSGDYVNPQARYAQSLLVQRPANTGHWSDGVANASRQILAAYLMKKDGDQKQAAQDAFLNAMGPQQTGHPGMEQATPGGYESVSKALRDMPDNPYAGRLNMQLQMAQALQGAQAAEADQSRIGELRTRKVLQNEKPFELTERYSGGGQWAAMGDPVPLWKPEKPETDSDILEINQLIDTLGKLPEGDPRREPYQARLTKITSSQPLAQVNMNPGEPKANEELGKAIGGRLAAQVEAGDKAYTNLQTLNLMESASSQLEQAGGATGALAEPSMFATSLMQAAGFDPTSLNLPADAGPAQVLNSLSNKLTLGKIGGPDGMPANNFSDADRAFIESTVPRLTDTPSAFRAKLFIDKRMAERSIAVARAVEDGYNQGQSASEIGQAVAEIKRQPLFSESEIQTLQAATGGETGTAQPYTPNAGNAGLVDRLKQHGFEVVR